MAARRRLLGATLALMALVPARVGFSAPLLQEGGEAPLYPSIITADYKGKSYPVTAVAGEMAEISVDGQLRRLPTSSSYQTPRAVGFAPGYVRFRAQNAASQMTTMSYRMFGAMGSDTIPGGTVSKSGDYECTLVASEAHADCYIAVVFYRNDPEGNPDPRTTAIGFGKLGDLAAGRETKVAIHSAYYGSPGTRYFYFPLIYSKGVEIRSDQSDVSARYFRRGEMATHVAMLARYREQNPDADLPARPYIRFQPQLPPGVDPRSLPSVIMVKFSVMETGEVDSIEIEPTLNAPVDHEIRRAIGGWLFLPRLKKGHPVRASIALPLSFEHAAK